MVNRSHTLEVLISCPQNYGLCLADTLIPCNINYFTLKVSWHPIRFDNIMASSSCDHLALHDFVVL